MKNVFYFITGLLAVLLLGSCSTKKNTKASRFYHAFNSRYNIYYNGKTSFDEALLSLQNGYKESYSEMIFIHPVSSLPKEKQHEGGPFDRAIEKSNKAIKLHSIKAKPLKKPGWRNDPKQRAWQEQEEYNPFLKKCWLMMGQAQFYNADFLQASATFSYIARHYAHEAEVVAEAKLWQARSYAEMGWIYESGDILDKLDTHGIPKKNLNQYATVYADYLIKNRTFEEAIPYLKTAIKAEKNRRQRARMKYLLGQLYTEIGQEALAYKTFGEVIRSNPPYELEFAARIRQTEVFTGENYHKVVRMLNSMAKNDKNKNMLDQIYYALGNVYLSREDTVKAINSYESGIEKSTQNGLEKAVCQIKLGDLYFHMRNYVKAQPCFSGALAGIQKTYKSYERVARLSKVLDELVVHVQAVHLQDSLQTLAKMPEAERLAVIDKIIEQVKKDEEKAKEEAAKEAYLAEQEARGTGINRPGTEAGGIILPTAGGSGFYFYNPQAVAQGKTAFQRRWGRRTLEDNWRRRKKETTTFNDPESNGTSIGQISPGGTTPTDTTGIEPEEAIAATDPKTREYYLQQLPLTREDKEASDLIIEDGLYNMAMIYKDKLEDMRLATDAFEELERRFPNHRKRLESYYQLYLMGLRYKNGELATNYKNKLIRAYPQSDYAVAISDPNYEYNIRMMDRVQDSIYQATYNSYIAEDTVAVRRNFRYMNETYPLAALIPKFMFLNALTYVQAGDAEGFKQALKVLLDKYPKADVSELAGEMLKGVLRGRVLVQGGVRGMNWNLRFGLGEDGLLSAADSARIFIPEENMPHQVLLLFPTGAVDRNQLLFAVAAYNFSNFMVKTFDMAFEEVGPMSLLAIRGFFNFDEVLHYYKMIYEKEGYATALHKEIAIIPISDANYETLMRGKTLDEYVAFFHDTFGDRAPELALRWQARIDGEMLKQADTEAEEVPEEPASTVLPVMQETTVEQPKNEQSEVSISTRPIEEPKKLTLEDIEAIRRQEAAEKEQLKAKELESRQQTGKEITDQHTVIVDETLQKQQKETEEAVLKAKADREKQLQKDKKARLKQRAIEQKAKEKARRELRKQKEREYKLRLKAKEKKRKEKERMYKEKLKAREKARREAQKNRK